MHRFPFGCCDDASDLLAFYLKQNGIETAQINGVYRDEDPENITNHVWLKTQDGLIIDITGDQFRLRLELLNYSVPVYVGDEDALHCLFQDRRQQANFEFELNETMGQRRMFELYNIISEYL